MEVKNKLPPIPMTVNQRAPIPPIQRPVKPAIRALIRGIKTIAKNIYILLKRGI